MTLAELRAGAADAVERDGLAGRDAGPVDLRRARGSTRRTSPGGCRAEVALAAGTQAYAVPGGAGRRGRDLGRVPAPAGCRRRVSALRVGVLDRVRRRPAGLCGAGRGGEVTMRSAVGYIVFGEVVAGR